jgi:hypothetical protein
MKNSNGPNLIILLAIVFGSILLNAQVNVTTWHNDIGRTGQNKSETSLTPTSVNKNGFGKICSAPVDGQIYAQPLVVTGLTIGRRGLSRCRGRGMYDRQALRRSSGDARHRYEH